MRDWLDIPGFSKQEFGQKVLLERLPIDKIVLHSTEGSNWPSYRGGYTAPHVTVDPRARETRQHIPFSQAGYALVAPTDGTHTNTGGAVQVEIIGSCVVDSPLPSVLNFNEDELGYLALVLKDISDATGIPLVSNVQWLSYPASFGNSTVRLTSKQWYDYDGVLGHQHVPGNLHGDPGQLNVARILEIANSGVTPVGNPIVVTPPPVPAGPVVIAQGVPAPDYPLPSGSYFGPKSGPIESVSGYYSHREDLRRWQQRMKDRGWFIAADGLYGSETAGVAHAFEVEKYLTVDVGLIGPEVWGAAWTADITRG